MAIDEAEAGNYYPFEFEAPLERHVLGKWTFLVVYLPADFDRSQIFRLSARPRLEAEVGERGWSGAWQPCERGYYLKLPPALLKAEGLNEGDRVEVRFRLVRQDTVEVPDELKKALTGAIGRVWEQLKPGHRSGSQGRSLAPSSHRTVLVLFTYGSSGRWVMTPTAGRVAASLAPQNNVSC